MGTVVMCSEQSGQQYFECVGVLLRWRLNSQKGVSWSSRGGIEPFVLAMDAAMSSVRKERMCLGAQRCKKISDRVQKHQNQR